MLLFSCVIYCEMKCDQQLLRGVCTHKVTFTVTMSRPENQSYVLSCSYLKYRRLKKSEVCRTLRSCFHNRSSISSEVRTILLAEIHFVISWWNIIEEPAQEDQRHHHPVNRRKWGRPEGTSFCGSRKSNQSRGGEKKGSLLFMESIFLLAPGHRKSGVAVTSKPQEDRHSAEETWSGDFQSNDMRLHKMCDCRFGGSKGIIEQVADGHDQLSSDDVSRRFLFVYQCPVIPTIIKVWIDTKRFRRSQIHSETPARNVEASC